MISNDSEFRVMNDLFADVAEAFGRKAQVYDAFGENHPNLGRMRQKVRDQLCRLVLPGSRLLELNAGTGNDALYLVQKGYFVHATDVSAGMVAAIQQKIASHSIQEQLTVQQLSFTQLNQLDIPPVDLIFSDMGGLNCIPDLPQVAQQLPRLLRPGGYVVWVIMPNVCLWELAAIFVADFQTAFRRLRKGGVLAKVEGQTFQTYYFSPTQVIHNFGNAFRFVSIQGLSVFTPTADRKQFAHRFPRLYRALVWLDDRLADRSPFYRLGDFFILTMQYQNGLSS